MHHHLSDIGRVLVRLRVERRETIGQMADRLDVSLVALSAIEHGRRAPDSDFTNRLVFEYALPPALASEIQSMVFPIRSDKLDVYTNRTLLLARYVPPLQLDLFDEACYGD